MIPGQLVEYTDEFSNLYTRCWLESVQLYALPINGIVIREEGRVVTVWWLNRKPGDGTRCLNTVLKLSKQQVSDAVAKDLIAQFLEEEKFNDA